MTRIMIAHEPVGLELVRAPLEGYELVVVSDFNSARYQILEDGLDLFIIGIHFDESRAVELIEVIRKDSKHAMTPIILVRLTTSSNADLLRITISALVKIGAVNQYFELDDVEDVSGAILNAVNAALPAAKNS